MPTKKDEVERTIKFVSPDGCSTPCWSRCGIDTLLVGLLALSILLSLFTFLPRNYEMTAISHVATESGVHYGGSAQHFITEGNGVPFAIHNEALGNYSNVTRSLAPDSSQGYVARFTSTDRLFSSWISGVIVALGFGLISVYWSFVIQNLFLWVAAMLLIYKLGARFASHRAGLIAACVIAVHPVHTLMFRSVKVANIGAVYLLFFMVLYEQMVLEEWRVWRKFLMLFLITFIGFYCGGGAQFAVLYLLGRFLSEPRNRNAFLTFMLGSISFVLCQFCAKSLNQSVGIVFVADEYHLSRFVGESVNYLKALALSADTGELAFFGKKGWSFWIQTIPHHFKAHFLVNPFVFVLGYTAMLVYKQLRPLFIPSLLLLAVHVAPLLVGWDFVYGYLVYPSSLLSVLGFSVLVARFFEARIWTQLSSAVLLLACMIWYSQDTHPAYRHQLNCYYGNVEWFPNKRVVGLFPQREE